MVDPRAMGWVLVVCTLLLASTWLVACDSESAEVLQDTSHDLLGGEGDTLASDGAVVTCDVPVCVAGDVRCLGELRQICRDNGCGYARLPCPKGEWCDGEGWCVRETRCATGQMRCTGAQTGEQACVDVTSDPNNCGGCDRPCIEGQGTQGDGSQGKRIKSGPV